MQIHPTLAAQLALAAAARQATPTGPSLADEYRFNPEGFLQDILGIRLYAGFSLDWVRDVAIGWLHGHAREAYGRGKDPVAACRAVRPDLPPWEPGQPVVNTFVLQGGSGLGKSVVVAGILLWAGVVSKSFTGVVYAPVVDQAYRTTWRYLDAYLTGSWPDCQSSRFTAILAARKGKELSPSIELSPLWSISTKATNGGATKIQGQHVIVNDQVTAASVHICEEADAIDDPALFDAISTMVSKGVALWFCNLNPATATAPVQDVQGPSVKRYELSVLDHPNVIEGRDVIPGASNRAWIENVITRWAEEVDAHDIALGTFELSWIPGRIFRPFPPWYWRVLGIVPPTGSTDSAVPETLFIEASRRDWRAMFATSSPTRGTLGVDVARSESGQGDTGSISRRWRGCVQTLVRIREKDTRPYVSAVLRALEEMAAGGCLDVEVRIDAGGGFGGGVADQLIDHEIGNRFRTYRIVLINFGGTPIDRRRHRDWITGAYLAVAEVLRTEALVEPSRELRQDLCGRKLFWGEVSLDGGKVDVVYLEPKRRFRERNQRSPDDGDAVALACAPWVDRDGAFAAFDGGRWGAAPATPTDEDRSKSPRELAEEDEDPFESSMRWRR